jgi:hypothetical protein
MSQSLIRHARAGTALLGLVLLAGCVVVDGADGRGDDRRMSYRCDDDRRMAVRLSDDRDRAAVQAGDERYELRLDDRDGDRYVYEGSSDGDDVRLTISDDRAELEVEDGDDFEDCRERS